MRISGEDASASESSIFCRTCFWAAFQPSSLTTSKCFVSSASPSTRTKHLRMLIHAIVLENISPHSVVSRKLRLPLGIVRQHSLYYSVRTWKWTALGRAEGGCSEQQKRKRRR